MCEIDRKKKSLVEWLQSKDAGEHYHFNVKHIIGFGGEMFLAFVAPQELLRCPLVTSLSSELLHCPRFLSSACAAIVQPCMYFQMVDIFFFCFF